MVFVGNTDHTVPYMLKHSDLFDPLPEKFHDSAFLDRIHSYIPGWEVDVIRGEMFSSGYGFVVDYLAEILKSLRSHDFSDLYKGKWRLSDEISTRDRDGIHKTFSGLMKILFPHGGATVAEIEEVLRVAMEGRKRVKDQLLRIDATYPKVNFAYLDQQGTEHAVTTLEEQEFPGAYHRRVVQDASRGARRGGDGRGLSSTTGGPCVTSASHGGTSFGAEGAASGIPREPARGDVRQALRAVPGRGQTNRRHRPVPPHVPSATQLDGVDGDHQPALPARG
jgi:hypothetical protein